MRTFFLGLTFLFIFVSLSLARPPSEILANYNFSKQLLNIEVNHSTHSFDHDFIKKISVIKGKEPPKISYFPNQRDIKKQSLEVPLEAVPEEKIIIEAQCIAGGMKRIEFVIPSKEELNSKQE